MKKTNPKSKLSSQEASFIAIAVTGLILLVIVLVQGMSGGKTVSYYKVSSWPASAAKNAFSECVSTATGPGSKVGVSSADIYCGCTVNGLQTIYKNSEQMAQAEKEWATKGFPPSVIAMLRVCAKQANVPLSI